MAKPPLIRIMLAPRDMLGLRELATEMNVTVDTAARMAIRMILNQRRAERDKQKATDDKRRNATVE